MDNLSLNERFTKVTGLTIKVKDLIDNAKTSDEMKKLYNELQWYIPLLISSSTKEGKYQQDGVTKASLLADLYNLLIEQDAVSVEGLDELKTLLSTKTQEELNDLDVIINLNGDVLTESSCNIKSKSIKIEDVGVSSTGAIFNSSTTLEINGLEVSGKKNPENARISVQANEKVHITGVDFSKATSGYNCLEINLSNENPADEVIIEDCYFANMTNNCILVFGVKEGGVVTIKNCKFDMPFTSEAVRISNTTNAEHFTVNIIDCEYKYTTLPEDTEEEIDEQNDKRKWIGFILFEDYNKKEVMEKPFAGLTINVTNVTQNGVKMKNLGVGTFDTDTQFACMSYDFTVGNRTKGMIYDLSHYPTFNFR